MIEYIRRPIAGLLASGLLLTGILGAMVVDRMLLLRNGREIVLPIRPVDPRDLFKGDFAGLSYDISRLDAGLVSGLGGAQREQTVYVTLERDAGEVWKPVSVARTLPAGLGTNQIAIRGRTNRYAEPDQLRPRTQLPAGRYWQKNRGDGDEVTAFRYRRCR